jgi:hypothetical protein
MKQNEYLFYNTIESKNSAEIIVKTILPFFKKVNSFLDLGCGVGAWSKEFEKIGFSEFHMIDHPQLDIENLLVENKKNFIPVNLDTELPPSLKTDFTMCIEVLEHFKEERALQLLKYISETSDIVLFSAAVPNQKGVGHINEQNHSYWHNKFEELGYKMFDGFKPLLFNHNHVIKYFHIQNMFIYYKDESTIDFKGLTNISSKEFEIRSIELIEKKMNLGDLLNELPKSFARSFNKRLNIK